MIICAYYLHKFAYRFSWIGKGSIQNHFFEIGEVATNLGEWCRRAYCLLCKYQNVPWLWKQLMEEIRLASWGWCFIHGGAGFLPSVSSMTGLNGRKWWILRIFTVGSVQKQFSLWSQNESCWNLDLGPWQVLIRMPKNRMLIRCTCPAYKFCCVTPTIAARFDIVEADPPITQQLQFEELEAASWPAVWVEDETMPRSVQHLYLQCTFGGDYDGIPYTYVNVTVSIFGFLRIQCFDLWLRSQEMSRFLRLKFKHLKRFGHPVIHSA